VVLDTQSVHAAASVPAATTGKDPGKKVPGRKRCLATDVLGLVVAVVVLAASPEYGGCVVTGCKSRKLPIP
jgi:hypothetical protein